MLEFDHSTTVGTTLYKEVKRRVLRALAAGEWKPGEAIPAEKKLCELFSVSIGTLRKAIDELVAENILIRHQGRGTFVSMHNREQQMFRFFNVANHDGTKSYPHLELIAFAKKKAGTLAVQKLRQPGSKVYEFTNVLSLQGAPVIVDDITVPDLLFVGLTEAVLRNRPNTLYSLYQVRFGISIIRIEERLRAVSADARYADLLHLAIGAPLLEVRRVAYSYDDQPVEWRISHINTEHHEYMAQAAHYS
ncbi:Putative regulator protein [Herminiimonas arsenicoxydans]|uniref:Regulator protein n=2 Tax=Herminiimonas arsenicoxydans TaxID=204773 RepID=A4GA93_HERAR|nr:Putative regulator protein [Herminiimonas arsenicoxydans]